MELEKSYQGLGIEEIKQLPEIKRMLCVYRKSPDKKIISLSSGPSDTLQERSTIFVIRYERELSDGGSETREDLFCINDDSCAILAFCSRVLPSHKIELYSNSNS